MSKFTLGTLSTASLGLGLLLAQGRGPIPGDHMKVPPRQSSISLPERCGHSSGPQQA
jgi:hypothetical protein